MKVISGILKGRNIEGYNIDGTRPTMDRVKESLFAIIQNNIKNSIVLDLFAGSGSLGIEAISNGANTCYFIDNNKEVIKVLNQKEEPVVFILWGNFAKEKAKYITNPNHYIITSPHPSPFSARNGFFGSKPFSKTNEFLKSKDLKEINWDLSK